MVQEIIKIIDEKIAREIEKINQEKEKELLRLSKDYENKLKDLKSLNLQKFKKEVESETENFFQQKKMESNFALEEEKNNIIDDIYKKAEKKILSQEPKEFKKIIEKLADSINKHLEGEISAGPKTAVVLKDISSLKRFKIKGDLPDEGFLLRGKEIDFDFRISQILKELREKQELKIVNILFS